jgi:hypothetical protein
VACKEDFLIQKWKTALAGEIRSAECVKVLMVAKADLLLMGDLYEMPVKLNARDHHIPVGMW